MLNHSRRGFSDFGDLLWLRGEKAEREAGFSLGGERTLVCDTMTINYVQAAASHMKRP